MSKKATNTYIPIDEIRAAKHKMSDGELKLLHAIDEITITSEKLEEVMDYFFDHCQTILPTDRLSLCFITDSGRRLLNVWVKTNYSPILFEQGSPTVLEKTELPKLLANREVRIIHNLLDFQEEHPESENVRLVIEEGCRSSMSYPISIDGQGVGFLFFAHRDEGAYGKHHAKHMVAISRRIQKALEIVYRIEQQKEINDSYVEMLSFVAHELKSPLSSIVLDSKLLLDDYLGPLNKEQREKLVLITKRGDYLMDLVKDYLNLAKVEGGSLAMSVQDDVNFKADIIDPCLDLILPQAREKNVTIDFECPDDDIILACDPELLRIVVSNLLSNAVKYGNDNGSVVLMAGSTVHGIVFSVWNEGPGFPQKQSHRLFQKFSRLASKQLIKKKGTGLGLYLAWKITNLHKGTIDARSEEGLWAEFTVRLPRTKA
jgi:signal transduction histidine kinase